MKVHDWLDTLLQQRGKGFVCFDVTTYLRRFKSNTDYYDNATDPRVFLAALAIRQPEIALTVLQHLVPATATLRSTRIALRVALDDAATRGSLAHYLRCMEASEDRSPSGKIARYLLRWRTGHASGRAIWFVVQAIAPDSRAYPELMTRIRALVPMETWASALTETTANNSRT